MRALDEAMKTSRFKQHASQTPNDSKAMKKPHGSNQNTRKANKTME